MVIFDSDRCFERDKVKFDLLSIKDIDEYGYLFCCFLTNAFKADGQTVLIDINRIDKTFRITINDDFSDGFDPEDLSTYENENIKTAEVFFHALNYYFSKTKNRPNFAAIPEKIDYDGTDSVWINFMPYTKLVSNFRDIYRDFISEVEKTEASQKLFQKETE